jgi:hypothetical protein
MATGNRGRFRHGSTTPASEIPTLAPPAPAPPAPAPPAPAPPAPAPPAEAAGGEGYAVSFRRSVLLAQGGVSPGPRRMRASIFLSDSADADAAGLPSCFSRAWGGVIRGTICDTERKLFPRLRGKWIGAKRRDVGGWPRGDSLCESPRDSPSTLRVDPLLRRYFSRFAGEELQWRFFALSLCTLVGVLHAERAQDALCAALA